MKEGLSFALFKNPKCTNPKPDILVERERGDPFRIGDTKGISYILVFVFSSLYHMGLDDDDGDHARVVEATDGDHHHHHQGDEHRVDDVFPSRKIARAMREKLFHALRVVWMQFELYGWYVLLALVVYLTFRRQIRGCLANSGRRSRERRKRVSARKNEKSSNGRDENRKSSGRRRRRRNWTSKTNIDKRIEAVEKKANRLGVAKQRKGHVLGRE